MNDLNKLRINSYLERKQHLDKKRDDLSVKEQIERYRNYHKDKEKRNKFKKKINLKEITNKENNTKKFFTFTDIINKNNIDKRKELGWECFELTNKYRLSKKKKKLDWDDDIYKICLEHSKNMAEKKIKFGHYGFTKRINKLNFKFLKAFENVAYSNYDVYKISECTVDGWITSVGHRKNLLSDSTHVAIAAYFYSERWYFTQIFIKK